MPNKATTYFPARKRLIAAAIASCFVNAPAWANPTGPQVVNGAASFSQAGKLLTVNNTNGAIINWNSFSIGASETTRFNQASASSSVLNRVIANDPSVLLGTLSSNGKVWLVNPAGILVGQGAKIDVAGFVASTLNVANQDFLAGRLNFGATPNAGSIQNDGQITTPSGGSVYLVASSVTNNGIINAPNGEVVLAAGQTVQLLDTGTPGVSVAITGAQGNVTNLGQIVSEAGQIGIAGVLVNNSGTLNASSVVKQGGRIFLKASQDAYVDGAGRIVATGTKGGSIAVLGNRVAVTDNASLDASGQNGGGTVLVGGDEHGANPDVQNATTAYIGSNASIKADATHSGNGGKVIVWSDDHTQFYGAMSARGGAQSGNGGYVETSGKRALNFAGSVDTSAPNGKTGTLLLDPDDIVIADMYGGGSPDDVYGGTGSIAFADGGSPSTFTISTGTLESLSASTNIQLQANNSITMGAISGTYTTAPNTLTLQQIGSVSMTTTTGAIDLGSGNTLNIIGTGSLDLSAGSTLNVGPIIAHSGSVTLTSGTSYGASSSILTAGSITTSGGGISITGGNYGTTTGVTVGTLNTSGPSDGSHWSGSVTITTIGGNISTGSIITAATNPSNTYYGGGSVLLQTNTGTITINGDIDARGVDGDATNTSGLSGGNVDLVRSAGTPPSGTAVNVTGGIYTYGGKGAAGTGGDGGEGGYVNIASSQEYCCSSSAYALIGDITVGGNIDAHGGAGDGTGPYTGGWGGYGGYVYVAGNGAVKLGATLAAEATTINTAGGDTGNSVIGYSAYNDGGQGGAVTVQGTSILINGSIDAHGGRGADGGEGYGYGGGSAGGSGGTVQIGADSSHIHFYDAVPDENVTTLELHIYGAIDTHGGDGGNGLVDDGYSGAGNGGGGGVGGSVQLAAAGPVSIDRSVLTYGGIGGYGEAAGTSVYGGGIGGYGGGGGSVDVYGGGILIGGISAYGGAGGTGGDGTVDHQGGDGASGGNGNSVNISSTGDITISGPLDTHGGQARDGGAFGGSGGHNCNYVECYDGNGGSVTLHAGGAVSVHSVVATGGNGGSGMAGGGAFSGGSGGDGGSGGSVDMTAGSVLLVAGGTGTISTYGGNGGNGGDDSANAGAGGNGAYGGYVYLDVTSGPVTTGDIDAHGGDGGNAGVGASGYYGGDGGWGGTVEIYADADSITTGSILTRGGDGGNGGGNDTYSNYNGFSDNSHYGAGIGGDGGGIDLEANNAVAVNGSIDASGGKGGSAGGSYSGGSGGYGGNAAIDDPSDFIDDVHISGASITVGGGTGTLTALGGPGGPGSLGYSGGDGGDGGYVSLFADGADASGAIFTTGGAGGAGDAGNGIAGSDINWDIYADTITLAASDFGFIANGTVNATSAFEFDPVDTPSFLITSATFAPLTGIPTVKFGNGTTTADLTLSGPIDLNSNSNTTLSMVTSGVLDQQDSTAGAGDAMLAVTNLYAQGGSVSLSGVNVTGTLTASASSDIQLDIGSAVPSSIALTPAMAGRWLLYSSVAPSDPTLAGLNYNFKQYAASFGGTVLGAGNGLLYSITPSLTPSLVGTVSKVYDAKKLANFASANFSVSGAINGDSAVLNPAIGTYDDKNVGTSKTVTANSLAIASVLDISNKPVYGYQLSATSANAAIGTITPAPLTLAAVTDSKVYDGTTASTGVVGVTGLMTGDSLSGVSQSYASKNILGANLSTLGVSAGYTLSDGNSGGNYTLTTTTAPGTITQRPLSTWIGGTSGNWSVASNWDALPDLSNVAAVSIPSGTTVTYDAAAGTTNLTSLTAGGLSIAGGTLNIADSLTVSSSFSQTGGALGAFGSGSSASITQATGNLSLPAITVAKLDLSAPAGAITQSGPLAALTLITQSQGTTTLDNPGNQVAGRVDMTAGGPLTLWASGNLSLGAIDAGANPVVIKAGGAILQASGTGSSTNIIAGSADLSSIFGGASGGLAISTNTQLTGALTATVGAEADFGGIRIQNTGAQPASVMLTDNAIAGASVSFLNTGDITSTSGISLKTVTGGDLALLSNGNITWDGGSLSTPTGSVLVSADGSLGVTGTLSSPVDLALSSTTSINVSGSGSVVTAGTGTASFTAPSVALNGSVDSADDVGIIATTISLGAGSSTGATHDVILAAGNITATNATVSADHDISAAVTGDMRLNGSGFTAGNDIYVKLLGATSTLYLNDVAGLPPSFLWAQAPSTIHLNFAAQAFGGMVVDGIAVDPLTFVSTSGGSGLFYGAAKTPATAGAGLDVVYGVASGTTTVPPTLFDAVMAAISSSTISVTPPAGTLTPGANGNGLGSPGDLGDQTVGGTEGQFGGDEEEENKTDKATGLKKKSNKSITKKLSTCS